MFKELLKGLLVVQMIKVEDVSLTLSCTCSILTLTAVKGVKIKIDVSRICVE